MAKPKIGFVVFGVHKDGLEDPLGTPFIDDALIASSKTALRDNGVELVEHDVVIASKSEARTVMKRMRNDDEVDGVILFSGTWVWAAHLIGAVQDYAKTGKGLCVWTHPGSQGWRPVGGLVMHGALKEVEIDHKFVYGAADDAEELRKVTSFCQASYLKNRLNLSTFGIFGGRGMGQTVGSADSSQWMRTFGVDIDTRDTTSLIRTAEAVSENELRELLPRIKKLFGAEPEDNETSRRSMRLYLALRKLVQEYEWDLYSIQSFPGLGDDYSASCFAQSMMLEDGWGTSNLGDGNTALSVHLCSQLSREPVYYGDLQHIDRATKEVKIVSDGACPPSLGGKPGPATFSEHGIPTEGEAGGLAVNLVCKPGEGVLVRLGRVRGEFEMLIARCTVFEPSEEQLEQRKAESGIPFWPHAFATVHGDIEPFLQGWYNEYAVLAYGEELYDALVDFCRMTGINAVLP